MFIPENESTIEYQQKSKEYDAGKFGVFGGSEERG